MISVARVIDPGLVTSYINRNGGTGTSFYGFAKTQSANGTTKQEIESSWLIVKGGSGARLNEQWGTYLGTKGFTTGSLEERMKAFFATGTQA